MASFGFSFRKGAPFQARFRQVIGRLVNAGILEKWTQEVMANRVREMRAAAGKTAAYTQPMTEDEVVLGLIHLQGAFYMLLLGCILALPIFLVEYLTHSRSNTTLMPP
ncbi:uncharacterized protein [Cherax quadricarinatus]|uniref:uncharacterized protein n=1 Tax=Cherax quadricarinatus TaxID=27406 RepID=UPI00387EDEB5